MLNSTATPAGTDSIAIAALNTEIENLKKANIAEIAKLNANNGAQIAQINKANTEEIAKLNTANTAEKTALKNDVSIVYNKYSELEIYSDNIVNEPKAEYERILNLITANMGRKKSYIPFQQTGEPNKIPRVLQTDTGTGTIPELLNIDTKACAPVINLFNNTITGLKSKSEEYLQTLTRKKLTNLNLNLSYTPTLTSPSREGQGTDRGGLRNLQSTSDDLSFQQKMQTIFTSYKFPKMMVIHRSVEINSGNKNPINFIYNFDVLDYLDPITGNPNVFDVYLQKYQIFVDYGGFLFPSEPKKIEFVIVNKIVKNQMDSLSNSGAYLSYKLFSDSQQIFIKYRSITDVLEVFGSFFAIFSLLAQLLTALFKEVIFDMRLTNLIFKFVQNTPGKKDDLQNFILNKEKFDLKQFNNNDENVSFSSETKKIRQQSVDLNKENNSKVTEMANIKQDKINILTLKENKNKGKN